MKKFWTILRFELNNYFKSKGFLTATILLTLVIMGVIIVPTMIPGLLGDDKVSESSTDSGEQADTLGICVKTDQITDVDSCKGPGCSGWFYPEQSFRCFLCGK